MLQTMTSKHLRLFLCWTFLPSVFYLVAGPMDITHAKYAISKFLCQQSSIKSLGLIFKENRLLDQLYCGNSQLFDPLLLTPTLLPCLRSLKTNLVNLRALLKSSMESMWKLEHLVLDDHYDNLPHVVMDTFKQFSLPNIMHLTCTFGHNESPKLAALIGQTCVNTKVYKKTQALLGIPVHHRCRSTCKFRGTRS